MIPLQNFVQRCASNATASTESTKSTIHVENQQVFDKLVHQWWDTKGQFSLLAKMNTLRVPLIRDGLLQTTKRSATEGSLKKDTFKPLEGFHILDVGCGGGLLSEPLARLGAQVTGIDPTVGSIEIARRHAELDSEIRDRITYEAVEVEKLVSRPERYDAVVASEVVEHVQNFTHFIECCVILTKDGGSLFFTTINKTLMSFLFAKVAAEYVLRLVPKGLHEWNMFLPPEQLQEALESNGCSVRLIHGTLFNPLTKSWSWVKNPSMTYALHAVKHAS